MALTPAARERIRAVNQRLNLASKPFVNRILPWVVTVVVVFFSFIALAYIFSATHEASAKAAIVQREINDLTQQQQAILKQAQQVSEQLTAEQRQSLKYAHELVNRKRFSWSRLFADLESVVPDGARVARIAVRQVRSDGSQTVADLELTVIAKSPTAVTDMIAHMDHEGIFHAELRAQNPQRGKAEVGSEYELDVVYSPRAGFASSESDARAALERPSAELSLGGVR
jgi:Tfp pilus assembly protein PilN